MHALCGHEPVKVRFDVALLQNCAEKLAQTNPLSLILLLFWACERNGAK